CGDLEGLGVQGPAELGQLEGHLPGRRKRGLAAPPPPRMIRSPPGVGSGATPPASAPARKARAQRAPASNALRRAPARAGWFPRFGNALSAASLIALSNAVMPHPR